MSKSVDVAAGGCRAALEAWLRVLLEIPAGVQAAGRMLLENPGHLSSSAENLSAPGHSPWLRAPEGIRGAPFPSSGRRVPQMPAASWESFLGSGTHSQD